MSTFPSWVSLASPSSGRPLISEVEQLAAPLRGLANALSGSLKVDPQIFTQMWGPRVSGLGYVAPSSNTDANERAAWCLIGQWLVGYSLEILDAQSTVSAAHEWFHSASGENSGIAIPELAPTWAAPIPAPNLIRALLPYLLDTEIAATRRQVRSGQADAVARSSRKSVGVYFTPGDVAQFMVEGLELDSSQAWLDPACGSGVFLRAVLANSPGTRAYGVDINPRSADLAPFVMMTEEQIEGQRPWGVWHRHRTLLATGDALLLSPAAREGVPAGLDSRRDRRREVWESLEQGLLPARGPDDSNYLAREWSLSESFPELAGGVDVVIQNPPYAKPNPEAVDRYRSIWGQPLGNMYPAFVQQGILQLHPNGQMAAVVPSSLVAGSSVSIMATRNLLASRAGDVEILSFDRMPDGLFGDDIKTRCSILFLDCAATARLRVGPMRKITASTRANELKRGGGAQLSPALLRQGRLPKLHTEDEVPLLRAIAGVPHTIRSVGVRIGRVSPQGLEAPLHCVTVAPTAYNWIGVQRDPALAMRLGHTSTHPVYVLEAFDEREADALYAVMCSRLTYWLWRVYGDGFHVSGWLFDQVPAWGDSGQVTELAKLGSELWTRRSERPNRSLNGGKVTVSFPSGDLDDSLLDSIDELLIQDLGMSVAPVSLRSWVQETVLAGRRSVRSQK